MTASTRLTLTKSLRLIALLGTAGSAIFFLFSRSKFRENQIYSYYGLFIVVVLVLFSLSILKKYVLQVLRNFDLFVPAGIFLTVSSLTSIFAKNSIGNLVFTNLQELKLINLKIITFQLVFFGLINLSNTVLFVGWTTKLLLNFAKFGEAKLLQPFEEIKHWFSKTLILVVLKSIFILFSALALFPLIFSFTGSLASFPVLLYLLIPLIGAAILLVNLATALVLPHVLNSEINFFSELKEGIKISWANKSRTWLPVLLLLFCCGWITFIRVNYRKASPGAAEFGSSIGLQNSAALKFSFNFNNVWVATYQRESFWHTQLLKAVEEESSELNQSRIALLLIFLSVVVNLTIIKNCLSPEDEALFEKDAQSNGLSLGNKLALATLLLCFLPAEQLIADFKSVINNQKVPMNSQVISGQNNFKRELVFERDSGDTVEIERKENSDEIVVNHISSVVVKDFKDGSGQQIVAATGAGILFLDLNGAIKKSVPLEIKKSKESEKSPNDFYSYQHFVEVNKNGDLGLISYESLSNLLPGVFDLNGKMILPFGKGERQEAAIPVFIGDVDRNGIDELYEFDNGQIQKLSFSEAKTGNFVFRSDWAVFKNNNELNLLTNRSQAIIKNSQGAEIKKILKPAHQFGYFFDRNGQLKSLYFEDNQFGFFDLNGKLIAKYDAPLSQENRGFFELRPIYPGDARIRVFKAEAQYFESADNTEYLAVIANLTDGGNFVGMFYIYDSSGRIIYQELIEDYDPHFVVLPAADSNNGESLLIYTNNKIWKYTKQ